MLYPSKEDLYMYYSQPDNDDDPVLYTPPMIN